MTPAAIRVRRANGAEVDLPAETECWHNHLRDTTIMFYEKDVTS